MTKIRAVICLLGLLLFCAFAVAQVDDRARELLEGLEMSTDMPDEIRTLDQTMTMTLTEMGDSMITTTRTVIDYEGERAAIISQVMGTETVMIYRNGQMSMRAGGMTVPMPPGTDDAFEGIFDTSAAGGFLTDPNVSATYDGEVSYGDLLSGEQVTYRGNLDIGAGLASDAEEVRMVFGQSGELLGQVIRTQGQEFVMLYVGDAYANPMFFSDMEMYEYDSDTESYSLFATMSFEDVIINEPIDETVFQ